MILDHHFEAVRRSRIQGQASGNSQGQPATDFGMVSVTFRLADVMQEERQVQNERPLEAVKERRVGFVRQLFGLPDTIQLLQAHQRMLVGSVLMIKLVLNQTGQFAEFGNVFPEQADLVHSAQDGSNVAPLVENSEKRLAHMLVDEEGAIDERKLVANQIGRASC